MLQKLISISVNFIKVVGSLVSGITALFYATGFLAWNSRMVYLGMPESEIIDINYLLTGAQFFVSLPFRIFDGFLSLGLGWIILLIMIIIAGILIMVKDYNKPFIRWTFVIIGIVLVILLVISLSSSLFKYLLKPSESGVLFSEDAPISDNLERNYSKLILLTILSIIGALIMLSWQGKMDEAILDMNKNQTHYLLKSPIMMVQKKQSPFSLGIIGSYITPWKIASNIIIFLIAFIALINILMLPMNFIHPAVTKRYPVVNISFNQGGIYHDIQPNTKLFLLKESTGDKGNLMLYSRQDMKIFQIKQEYIKEFRIIGHRNLWD